ncbi:threonine synthase [Pseudidiomarina salilacus]|uniref:threonine synthase n=1 Tax=Pseudidiomarina salilacus TaxID=3384452 RepID=UPI0039855A6C
MSLVNLLDPSQRVSFLEAVQLGLGRNQGLFFFDLAAPWPQLDIDQLLTIPLAQRSGHILAALTDNEISPARMTELTEQAFNFPASVVPISATVSCLELFHGPTLAFKDFGARFMALALAAAQKASNQRTSQQATTIVTATSGDTGAAVAAAFYRQPNVKVVVLYPEGKVSPLQAKLFTTLNDNVQSIAIDGDFDQCQALVKQLFNDPEAATQLQLNSANSINISRLFAQVCYYFEAWAQLPQAQREHTVICVPSGNFGNVCAALIALQLGLPVKRVIAATNSNDTVPRYLQNQQWQPQPTQATLSNAMDISAPNNWPRVEALLNHNPQLKNKFSAVAVSETDTIKATQALYQQGYLSEPHAAVAWAALQQTRQPGEHGLIIGTAHPAKFAERVEHIIKAPVELPETLQQVLKKPELNLRMSADYQQLKTHLLKQSQNKG